MEASEPKWVTPVLNSLRLGGFQIPFLENLRNYNTLWSSSVTICFYIVTFYNKWLEMNIKFTKLFKAYLKIYKNNVYEKIIELFISYIPQREININLHEYWAFLIIVKYTNKYINSKISLLNIHLEVCKLKWHKYNLQCIAI